MLHFHHFKIELQEERKKNFESNTLLLIFLFLFIFLDENDLKEDNNTEDNFISYSREYLSKNSELKDEDQFEHFLQDDENSLDSGLFLCNISFSFILIVIN